MTYTYLNMDARTLHGTEEELIDSMADSFKLPQLEAIPNIAETETLIAAGHTPFTTREALTLQRQLQMGVSHAGKRH